MGTLYLIHFDEKLVHAQYYLGWTTNLDKRIEAHGNGNGGALMTAVNRAGIGWRVVRTWEGSRDDERRMKRWHKIRHYCPDCCWDVGRLPRSVTFLGEQGARVR
jgi:predicted GIY-YIG superfamily endonuclease